MDHVTLNTSATESLGSLMTLLTILARDPQPVTHSLAREILSNCSPLVRLL